MQSTQTIEEIQNFEGKYPKQLWYLLVTKIVKTMHFSAFCF